MCRRRLLLFASVMRFMHNCRLGDANLEAVMPGLQKCETIEILDLSKNNLAASGGKTLAKALPSWKLLQQLIVAARVP